MQISKQERFEKISLMINTDGKVNVSDLSRMFSTSEVTIRRDLVEMDRLGLLHRVHGGAIRRDWDVSESPVLKRMREETEAKKRIGERAASLVKPGETIFLGSGSTVLEVARHLSKNISISVITNSLPVANLLADQDSIDLVVIGGMLRQSELSLVGHIAEQALREFRADHVFMGMRAIDLRHGFTSDYLPETLTDRAILGISPHVVVVADHTKFGRISSVFLAPVTAAQTIITDRGLPEEYVNSLIALEIELMLV